MHAGDTLVVPSLDRLSRSLPDLIATIGDLRRRGVGFTSLHENLDTTTPGGRKVFHVFAALAEFIRELIVSGTHEGLAAACAHGRVGGRPTVVTPEIIRAARDLLPNPRPASPPSRSCLASTPAPSTTTSRTCASCAPPAAACTSSPPAPIDEQDHPRLQLVTRFLSVTPNDAFSGAQIAVAASRLLPPFCPRRWGHHWYVRFSHLWQVNPPDGQAPRAQSVARVLLRVGAMVAARRGMSRSAAGASSGRP